jgi:hypothetical protein
MLQLCRRAIGAVIVQGNDKHKLGCLHYVCVLTWPPKGKGHLLIVGTTKSPNLCPSPPRHLITKLKGSTESHFCIP